MDDLLRFLWIALCFLLSFLGGVPTAAGLTLCADFLLLFTSRYALGVALFSLVQLAYIQRLRGRLFFRRALLLPLLAGFLPLPALACGYALLFLWHFCLAIKKAGTCGGLSAMLHVLALVLFAACDISVAWGYLIRPVPGLIWTFYAPSQLLLALTARPWQPPQRPAPRRKGKRALPFSHPEEP